VLGFDLISLFGVFHSSN